MAGISLEKFLFPNARHVLNQVRLTSFCIVLTSALVVLMVGEVKTDCVLALHNLLAIYL